MSNQLTNIAKGIVMFVAVVHLIFTNIHVNALLLLEHELCGFIMFLFVLAGLLTLFETTRIRSNQIKEKIITLCICLLTSGVGLYLIMIYRNAIDSQPSLDVAVVNKAIIFSMMIAISYAVVAVLIGIDLTRKG